MRALLLGLCVFLVGCQTVRPEDVKTHVYRHGFEAIQRTNIPPDWTGQGVTVTTSCLWNQLAKSSVDQQYYCPPSNTVEELHSVRHPLVITGNYMSHVIPAAGNAANGALMGMGFGLGLAYQRVPQASQTTVTGGTVFASTISERAIPGLQFTGR